MKNLTGNAVVGSGLRDCVTCKAQEDELAFIILPQVERSARYTIMDLIFTAILSLFSTEQVIDSFKRFMFK